jgi:UDPglucose 6-dehydrogenase
MKIAVLGLWHQGIVGAACLADMGHAVVGADPNRETIDRLAGGTAPLFEPGLDALLASGIAAGRLEFSSDMVAAVENAPFVFIMFDTPVNERDESDVSGIFACMAAIAPALAARATVLVTAQVPVGTCDALRDLAAGSSRGDISVAYMPENLRLGQAIERFRSPVLPVIGTDDDAAFDRLLTVLGPLASNWQRVSLRTGEMIKHALNAFLAVSVCFANELGNLCDALGADGKRVGEVLRLEPRVGSKAMLLPGLGFSGGTLARDVQTLRDFGDENGLDTPLLDGAWAANMAQNGLVRRKLDQALPALDGARVSVLGLTYKADTSTLRRSASIEVIEDLVAAGAIVNAHDPRADRDELQAQTGFRFHENALDAIDGADALVLMTPWSDYRTLDFVEVRRRMSGRYVLDTAALWNADDVEGHGLLYDEIGRGRQAQRVKT